MKNKMKQSSSRIIGVIGAARYVLFMCFMLGIGYSSDLIAQFGNVSIDSVATRTASFYNTLENRMDLYRSHPEQATWENAEFRKFVRFGRFFSGRFNAYSSGGNQNPALALMQGQGSVLGCDGNLGLDWSNFGPFENSFGQLKSHLGRVESAAHDPKYPNIFYLGSNAGGFWKSIDAGESWYNTTDDFGLPGLGITDIEISEKHPGTIYISTGVELNGALSFGETFGMGIFKSEDFGESWIQLISFPLEGGRLEFTKKIILREFDFSDEYLFVVNHKKVIRYNISKHEERVVFDGGTELNQSYPYKNKNILDAEFLPSDKNVMMIGTSGFQHFDLSKKIEPAELHLTSDVYDQTPSWSLALLPGQPSRSTLGGTDVLKPVVAMIETSTSTPDKFFIAAGTLWREGANFPSGSHFYRYNYSSGNFEAFGNVSSPRLSEVQHVFYVSDKDWRNVVLGSTTLAGVNLSTMPNSVDPVSYFNSSTTHVDPRNFYVYKVRVNDDIVEKYLHCNDGGLALNQEELFSGTPDFRSMNGIGLQLTQFWGIEHFNDAQNPFVFAGGTQDNNAFSTEAGVPVLNYRGDYGGDRYDFSFDPSGSNLVLDNAQLGSFSISKLVNGSLQRIFSESFRPGIPGLIYSPHSVSKNGLFAATGKSSMVVFRSDNLSKKSNVVYQSHKNRSVGGVNKDETPVSIEADPFLPNTFYIAFADVSYGNTLVDPSKPTEAIQSYRNNFKVLRATVEIDGGTGNYIFNNSSKDTYCTEAEWQNIEGMGNFHQFWPIRDIAASTLHKGVTYLAMGNFYGSGGENRVYKVEYGSDFCDPIYTDISYNLGGQPVNTVEVYSGRGFDEVFIGNDAGILYTNEYIDKWVCLNNNLPAMVVQDIEVNEKDEKLYVGSFGRGIWETALPEIKSDLHIKALVDDDGSEPTLSGQDLWLSPSIYVTRTEGSDTPEDPLPYVTNFVKVVVENRGLAPTSISDKVHVYFSKASLGLRWPIDWVDREENGEQVGDELANSPYIFDAGNELMPGESRTLIFEWTPPNPNLLDGSSDIQRHFCLYARAFDGKGFNLAHGNGDNGSVNHNTYYNNNIAWKNITLEASCPTCRVIDWPEVRVTNSSNTTDETCLEYRLDPEMATEILANRRVVFQLNDGLYNRWKNSGGQAEGIGEVQIIMVETEKLLGVPVPKLVNVLELTQPKGRLFGFDLNPGDVFTTSVQMVPKIGATLPTIISDKQLRLHVTQSTKACDSLIGGQTFVFNDGLINPNQLQSLNKKELDNKDPSGNKYREMQIYPNPIKKGSIKIINYVDEVVYSIRDLAGKVLWESSSYSGEIIDIGKIQPGLYFIEERTSKGQLLQSQKLIKQ